MAEFIKDAALRQINAHPEMVARGWRLRFGGRNRTAHLGNYYLLATSRGGSTLIGTHIDPAAWVSALASPATLDAQPARFRDQHRAFLDATTPVITADPESVDVAVALTLPSAASFSVTVTGGTVSYSWQVDTGSGFAAITGSETEFDSSGANTDELSLTNVTVDADGFDFRCVVTNGVGVSATSAAATLSAHHATPAELGAIFWVEADGQIFEAASDPPENNDTIAEWHDRIGSFDLAAASNHLVYQTNVINGLPGLEGGTNRRASKTGTLRSGAWSITACGKRKSSPNATADVVVNWLSTQHISTRVAGISNRPTISDGVSTVSAPNAGGSTDTFVLSATRSGTSVTIRQNGPTNSASGTLASIGDLTDVFAAMYASNGAFFLNGHLAGFAVFPSAISGDLLTDSDTYWAAKYGVTLS